MNRVPLLVAGGLLVAALASGSTDPVGHHEAMPLSAARAPQSVTAREVVIAEAVAGEGAYQAPVIEGEELPDSPAADAASADKEAQMPAVEQPPAGVEAPGVDVAPEVPQPGATP